jgi:hypothetical protein
MQVLPDRYAGAGFRSYSFVFDRITGEDLKSSGEVDARAEPGQLRAISDIGLPYSLDDAIEGLEQ